MGESGERRAESGDIPAGTIRPHCTPRDPHKTTNQLKKLRERWTSFQLIFLSEIYLIKKR